MQAVDLNNSPITYSLTTPNLMIESLTGRIYLISKFQPNYLKIQTEQFIEIRATNGFKNISMTNKIIILNSNDKPPEFMNLQSILEIEEV